MYGHQQPKTTDFLKEGHDPEFEKAMGSITNMYDDLFKTTDYQAGKFDLENIGLFDPIENMWNDIMDIQPKKQPEAEEQIIVGEPVYEMDHTHDEIIRKQPLPRYLQPIPTQQGHRAGLNPYVQSPTPAPIYPYNSPANFSQPPNRYPQRY